MRRSVVIPSRVLHHEWISRGKVVTSEERSGQQTVIFLHGLLGSGKNLRTAAKRLTERHTHLSALLVDARGHGGSSSFHPPHTLHSCTMDVVNTVQDLNLDTSPTGIVGHSFGARIALDYLHTLCNSDDDATTNLSPPRQTWLLDSVPGYAHSSVADVIQAVSTVSLPIPNKKHLVNDLTTRANVDPAIAAWMTTNLTPHISKDGFQFTFDLDVVLPILEDFPRQDFYALLADVQDHQHHPCNVHVVRAGRNASWTPKIVEELEKFNDKFLKMHALDTGHWVHVDDLNGLLDCMQSSFETI